MANFSPPLVFAHIGDLHITTEREPNYRDFLTIVAQLATQCSPQLDFVVLPGDNADNGLPEQYSLIATALRMLSIPVYILPGDHDMEQGSLRNLYTLPTARGLPFAETIKGNCCIFLDVCGPGNGGSDFRLGKTQMEWLRRKLHEGSAAGQPTLLFMHTYPDDLKDEEEKLELLQMIIRHNIVLVDMGHTHYNEIANDGKTVYAATRSTGQIEEGPVGYSLVSIDRGNVSWRFKALAESFPYVLITSPADYRLHRANDGGMDKPESIHAVVFGAQPLQSVTVRTSGNPWTPMIFDATGGYYRADMQADAAAAYLSVEAIDGRGRPGIHTISPPTAGRASPAGPVTGSDRATIGPWPENGIPGTQLGPNRNAKPTPKK